MSATSIVIDKDPRTSRERVTVLEKGKPARRFTERHPDGLRVYEHVGNDSQGRREYRLMGTERLS